MSDAEKKFFEAIENPPAPTAELIKLLRDHAMLRHDDHTVCDEAADEIKRLCARVAELEKERDGALADACSARIYASDATVHLRVRVAELEVQLEQSRRLGKLGGYPCTPEHTWAEWLEDRHKRVAELEAAQEWRPIESAPKTPNDSTVATELLGWCPDETSPIGGDRRTIWWEPRLRGGGWYSDRDMVEHPTMWTDLPAPPKVAP